jgi:tetratricopeptide (TPR) repeat protein
LIYGCGETWLFDCNLCGLHNIFTNKEICMKNKWPPHIIAAGAYALFIALWLACASTPEASSARSQPALSNAKAYWERGLENQKNGKYQLAIEDYTDVIRLVPDLADAYNNRAWIYAWYLKTNFDQAIADANQALKLKPNKANYLDTRGWAYLGKGDYDRAIADFNAALRISPSLESSINGIAKARQEQAAPQQQPSKAAPQSAQPPVLYWTGDGGKGLSLAVLEPTGKGLAAQEQWMLPLIQGSLTGDFNRYSAMTIVDRQNLEKILAEQSQSLSGNYSENDYISIGRLTNARLILTGSIAKTANTFMLELSVADAESGERKASYPPKSVSPASVENLSAIKEAAADLLEQLGVTLTDRSLQALKNPVAITVVQGQAALAAPAAQTAQPQAVQAQVSDAQAQLAEVQAQIALSKGIAAQKQGTTVEALSYFIQAANYNPAMAEATSRMNILNANISSGNIGVDTRNEIAWRRQWVARLQEAETFFANYVKAPQPYNLVYSTDIQKGSINWQNETITLSFVMWLRPVNEDAWLGPINGVISAVKRGLEATGKASAWGLYGPRGSDMYNNFAVVAEIVNDKGTSIGRQTVNVSYGYEVDGGIITQFRRWDGTVSSSVKADDITDTLSIRIVSIDGITAENATRQKSISVMPEAAYYQMFVDRGAAEAAAAKASAGTLRVGDCGPGGGFIFYDKGRYADGWRYLEAAPVDILQKAAWGSLSDVTGTKTEIGSGKRNTELIIAALNANGETGNAAQLCRSSSISGYNDWFLPSKDELDLMSKNLKQKGLGGFGNSYYWSSSQYRSFSAWAQRLSDGRQSSSYNGRDEPNMCLIRAVRAF